LGGREHSALAGAILAARTNHVPVVLDGMSAIAVGCILNTIDGSILDHCVFANDCSGGPDLSGQGEALVALDRPCVLTGFANSADGTALGPAIAVSKSAAAVHANSVVEAG